MADSFPRVPWNSLTSLHPGSQNFEKQVRSLGASFGTWRNVTSDGNCLYRAFAWYLLEHLCRPFTDLCELQTFYNRLYYQEFLYAQHDEDLNEYLIVFRGLHRLYDLKKKSEDKIMTTCNYLLRDEVFMMPFIKLLRNLAVAAFLECKPENYYYEGVEEEVNLIARVGQLSGEFDYIGLGLALELDFCEIELGKSNFQETKKVFECLRQRRGEGWQQRLLMHVGMIEGHHYVFYPKQLEALEAVDGNQYHVKVEVTAESIGLYDNCMRAQAS